MGNITWPKHRVIIEVVDIEGKCPVYKIGDIMVIEEPKLVLEESDAVCLRAMSPLMTHIISAAGGIDPSSAEGGVLHSHADPAIPPERGVHYTSCPMPGTPFSTKGPVLFRLKVEGVADP
ncbi:MAG: TIGR04076 family protein [Candidatus Bathyarchaeota archaeon]|nr:TIGR04076 family protein [Candidatus Bathyarchaeota archaeon]